jgi:superkiller protein 3
MAAGRIDEAIECFNKLLQLKQDTAEVHYHWALALGMQKKYDDAIKHFARVLELDPKYPDARNLMGGSLMEMGRTDEAIAQFKEVLRINPGEAQAYINLGKAYGQLGQLEKTIQSWTKAAELKPDSVPVLNDLAWLLATKSEVSADEADRAIKYAQRACELTGNIKAEFLDTLATAYAAASKFDEAVDTANKAVVKARELGQNELADEIQKRVELFESGQRYRQK